MFKFYLSAVTYGIAFLYLRCCLRKLFMNGDFILLFFSPDGNEKPAKEKQIDFVAKKERPKKLLFLLTKFLFFLWT